MFLKHRLSCLFAKITGRGRIYSHTFERYERTTIEGVAGDYYCRMTVRRWLVAKKLRPGHDLYVLNLCQHKNIKDFTVSDRMTTVRLNGVYTREQVIAHIQSFEADALKKFLPSISQPFRPSIKTQLKPANAPR